MKTLKIYTSWLLIKCDWFKLSLFKLLRAVKFSRYLIRTKPKFKMVKDKSKPKGAISAYIFFTQAMREEQKSKNPSKTIEIGEFSKTCSEKWKVCLHFSVS